MVETDKTTGKKYFVKGGHAVMLEVAPNVKLLREARAWVDRKPAERFMHNDYHLTLAFIGRDLDCGIGPHLIELCEELKKDGAVKPLVMPRAWEMFGRRGTHLAAVCEGIDMCVMRKDLVQKLTRDKMPIDTHFGWRPHVTYAESRVPATRTEPMARTTWQGMMATALIVKAGKQRTRIEL